MNAANGTTQYRDESVADTEQTPGAPPQSLIGRHVGAYLITKRLGAGGVGEVFKGVDTMLKRDVAIKVLRHELAADPMFLERFAREAQLHAKLSHPNVAAVHAFVIEGDMPFMVMEYVAGISLDEFIRSGGAVPVERALAIFRRALDGIEHAHSSGIVHRDIKPANIMLADNGQVKVMDFGIARALDSDEHLTRHGHVAGTARSLSPEQIRGARADVRSDVYALGIVLYTLLAGRPPFDAETDYALMKLQLEAAPPPLHGLVSGLPPNVDTAVMRALEKDPGARFQSVAAFARALDVCLVEMPMPMPPAADARDESTGSRTVVNPAIAAQSPRLPSPRPPSTSRRRAGAIGLAVLALAGAGTALWPRLAARDSAVVAVPTPPATASMATAPAVAGAVARSAEAADVQTIAAPIEPRRLTIVAVRTDNTAVQASAAPHRFKPGERIRLQVTPSHDAHVYCYLQDEARQIVRFYPNRFNTNALVKAGTALDIPGRMRFELVANAVHATETVACFASELDVTRALPEAVVGTDFATLPADSLDEVGVAFERAGAPSLAKARYEVQVR